MSAPRQSRRAGSTRWYERVAVTASGCWEFQGSRTKAGYGLVRISGQHHYTHRLAYAMAYGPIRPGHDVCHHCDNPPCVNPAHLFTGTRHDNMVDAQRKGRLIQTWADRPRQVAEIKRLAALGLRQRDIGAAVGMSQRTVGRVLHGAIA